MSKIAVNNLRVSWDLVDEDGVVDKAAECTLVIPAGTAELMVNEMMYGYAQMLRSLGPAWKNEHAKVMDQTRFLHEKWTTLLAQVNGERGANDAQRHTDAVPASDLS